MNSKIERVGEAVKEELDKQLRSVHKYRVECLGENLGHYDYWLGKLDQEEFEAILGEVFDHFDIEEIYDSGRKTDKGKE